MDSVGSPRDELASELRGAVCKVVRFAGRSDGFQASRRDELDAYAVGLMRVACGLCLEDRDGMAESG